LVFEIGAGLENPFGQKKEPLAGIVSGSKVILSRGVLGDTPG
jgi:hypothetical protein